MMNRRQFLTVVAIAPAIRVHRAITRPPIPFDQLVAVTLRRYKNVLLDAVFQQSEAWKLIKEKGI